MKKFIGFGHKLIIVPLVLVASLFLAAFVWGGGGPFVSSATPSPKVGPSPQPEQVLGGNNLPDRCEMFDQSASRSLTEPVKTAGGKVFYIRATNAGSTPMFFQLFNLAAEPLLSSHNPIIAEPIGGTTASRTPAIYEARFEPAIDLGTGITFAFSDNFGSYSSSSSGGAYLDAGNLTVNLCYY